MKTKVIISFSISIFFIFCYPAKLIAQEKLDSCTDITMPVFTDVTSDAGLQNAEGERFSWGDFNNDGYPDLLIKSGQLYKNMGPDSRGNWKFTLMTKEKDSDDLPSFGVWGDYDNDGYADVTGPSGLWKNINGRKFKKVDKEKGFIINGQPYSASLGDYDNDGYIDIYITMGDANYKNYPNEDGSYSHQLWKNDGGIRFKKVSTKDKIGQTIDQQAKTYGRSAIWCDYDNDGYQEIYVGNYAYKANFLWKFERNQTVKDIAKIAGCAGIGKTYVDGNQYYGHTLGTAWADFDNDGDFDLWVANLAHKDNINHPADVLKNRGFKCDNSNIYINQGPPDYKFVDCRAISGIPTRPLIGAEGLQTIEELRSRLSTVEDELWYDVKCADFDNDGYIDVFVTQESTHNYARALLFHNLGNLKFKDVSSDVKIELIPDSGGVALADFDCDGFIDIVTSGYKKGESQKKVHLYKNKGNANSWIKFKLIGCKNINSVGSNRSAIGTIVKIKTKNGTQIRQVEGASGLEGQQNSMILHFGLGDIQKVDKVEISWPSGKKQKLTNLSVKKIHEITETL